MHGRILDYVLNLAGMATIISEILRGLNVIGAPVDFEIVN
jgi:hypothetical protein